MVKQQNTKIVQSHHIEITKTARYFTYGQLNPDTRNVWFVCHGYGQLAEYFIKKFEVLGSSTKLCSMSRSFIQVLYGKVYWKSRSNLDD